MLRDWDSRSDQEEAGQKLDTLRSKLLLRRWKQNLRKSFVVYLAAEYGCDWRSQATRLTGAGLDLEAGTDALEASHGRNLVELGVGVCSLLLALA